MKTAHYSHTNERRPIISFSQNPWVIYSHDTTWHDGCVAMVLPNGEMVALASERIGERFKHHFDSRTAYEYLTSRFKREGHTSTSDDNFFAVFDGCYTPDQRHHFNHASAAFYGSGFEEAAILIVDGQGPEADVLESTTLWTGDRDGIERVEGYWTTNDRFAAKSIGHFYTAVGALAGINGMHEEGKTMGLAAYGRPSKFLDRMEAFVTISNDPPYDIDPAFTKAVLSHTLGREFFFWGEPGPAESAMWAELQSLRTCPTRAARPTQDDADIAYAGQQLLERMMVSLAQRARAATGKAKLCLAGGVALNCVANQKIASSALFDEVYVFPAAGDDGQALGKLFHHLRSNAMVDGPLLRGPYLGPNYFPAEFNTALDKVSGVSLLAETAASASAAAAKLIAQGAIVGCFRGRSEIGPRALGHRSILADPRNPEVRNRINFFLKGREWFRPVAPIVHEHRASIYFELERPSPYMTFAVPVRFAYRSLLPSITHADGSARVQTLNAEQDEFLYRLLAEFEEESGYPILVNTSFNPAGAPLVETPADALDAFMNMPLDAMIFGDLLVSKSK